MAHKNKANNTYGIRILWYLKFGQLKVCHMSFRANETFGQMKFG